MFHNDLGIHRLKLLYVILDSSQKQTVFDNILPTIKNLDSAILYAKQQSELIIKNIQESTLSSIKSLETQKKYYENLINICRSPLGISKNDYDSI